MMKQKPDIKPVRLLTLLARWAFNAAWFLPVCSSASPLDGYWEGYIRDPHGSPVLKFQIEGNSQVTYCRVVVDPFFWHWEGVGTYSYSSSAKTFQMTLYYTNFNGYPKPKTPLGYFTGSLTVTDVGRHLEGTMCFAGDEGPSGDTYNWYANAPPPPDVQKPTIRISAPANGARLSNSVAMVRGTATDNARVAAVWYQLDAGVWQQASGTTNWTAEPILSAGSNMFQVYAVDAAGNRSLTNRLSLNYVVTSRLALQTNGVGTIRCKFTGNVLEVGRSYSVTAIPGSGQVFSNWTGGVTSSSAALNFVMQSNMILQANFIPNPFVACAGTYQGLFYETNGVAHSSSGFFSARTTSKGTFSAKLQLAGQRHSVSGQFDCTGVFSGSVTRKGLPSLSVRWQIDLGGEDVLTGHISDGTWTAELLADRAAYSRTNSAPQSGNYTLHIPGAEDSSTRPGGYGYGSLTVDALGNIKFVGCLGEGTKTAQKTFLSKQGQWPLYASLYSGKGQILGWLTFANKPESDVAGLISWIKLPEPAARAYPSGFTNETEAAGSFYQFVNGLPVLNFGTGQVWLANGNLPQAFTNQIALGADNKVTNLSSNKLTLTLKTSSGLFKGSVVDPATLKTIPIGGVVLQKQNMGSGWFFGTNQSGRVYFGP
jgi:hypothetical protein